MPNSGLDVEALSPPHRQTLDTWLADFDQSWHTGRLQQRVHELPPRGDPLRVPLLLGMVQIDLRRRWQLNQRIRVESYLKSLPELGTTDTVPPSLVLAEYLARRDQGSSGHLHRFLRRFPRQVPALQQLLAERGAQTPEPPSQTAETARGASGPPTAVTQKTLGGQPRPFGRYLLMRRLGHGSMGAVHLAYDTTLDRLVAIKMPRFEGEGGGDGPVKRFLQEARATARLEHPNLCPVYDVGEIAGVSYLTMAFIEGPPLSEFARHRKLTPRQIATIARKIALAMAEAHRQGVIHRDLKPANVLMKSRNEPVVMDFGLARLFMQDDCRLTRVGVVVGSPAYMAPEHIRGDAQNPASCDIYALGVILYEMLCGAIPFEGPSATVMARILTEQPLPPSARRKGVDPALEAICLKAMARCVADRYPSMTELAAALGEFLRQHVAGDAQDSGQTEPPVADSTATQTQPHPARDTGAPTRQETQEVIIAVSPAPPPAEEAPQRSKWSWATVIGGGFLLLLLLGVILGHIIRAGFSN